MPGQRLDQVNGNALVGQVCRKRSAAAVVASTFQVHALLDQFKSLRQTLGVKPVLDFFG